MFLPSTVYVKPQSAQDPATGEIVSRVHKLDPNIPVLYLDGGSIPYPAQSTAVDRWRVRKTSLVLAHRTVPFLTTFASPGTIVERMGVILNLAWQCPSNCSYCYLQSVLPADHMIYTNLDQLERELAVEPFAYPAILTLWTIISFASRQELTKVPANFHKAADHIRARFVHEGIGNKRSALDLLRDLLHQKGSLPYEVVQAGKSGGNTQSARPGATAKSLAIPRRTLARYYNKNCAYPVRITVSEFTDLIGLDHLCGYSARLMDLLARHESIHLNVRTKSSYVDEMIRFSGHGRVGFAMNFNTPHVIEKYEAGTALLEERLQAARKVQDAAGFRLRVAIEPMIRYPGCEEDYVQLVRRIVGALDPSRIDEIAMGCVRYSGRLEARIRRNSPGTDLFDDTQGLLPLQKHDRRRYPLNERVRLYQLIHDEFRKRTGACIRLGAETADAWDSLGWDRGGLIRNSVFQCTQSRIGVKNLV